MSPGLAAILAPLTAMALILALRRLPAALALAGGTVGLLASLVGLADAVNGVRVETLLPGLPGMPLRLVATPLTTLLSLMVSSVGSMVLVYAVGYMKGDSEQRRFFATLMLFLGAMQTLVLAGDWVLLLAAWELIGLSSYLLIGFWYRSPGVSEAASRAFLYTRSADLGLYIAAFVLIAATGSSELAVTLNTGGNAATVAGFLLLLAAMGKSAQSPLHDWLQRAMAGPTPVSALLHSATLVAAGAILLIRTAPMLSPATLLAIGIVGGITTLLTGLMALAEHDLKRMLAASTSSQYGLMLLAVAAGFPLAALLHLFAHAAIKSALFLGAGVFQHSRGSTTLAELTGAGRDQPRIFLGFALAALSLAGIPPLSGFFSKDAIIAATLDSPHAAWLASFALAGTLLTGAYMARALRILWRNERRGSHTRGLVWMGAGMAGLVMLAALLGAAFPGIESLVPFPMPENTLASLLGTGAALTGLTLGWLVPSYRLLGPISPLARRGFAIAGGFDAWLLRPALAIAHLCEQLEKRLYNAVLAVGRVGLLFGRLARRNDEQGIDGMIFSLVRFTVDLGRQARTLQSGLIHREMGITMIGTALLIATLAFVLMLS